MKRLLVLALAVASIGVVGLGSEAKAVGNSSNSVMVTSSVQWQRDRYGRRIYNRRSVRRTRVVRVGRRLYRETYVVRYLPNGRIVDTRLISRVRIS